MLSTSSPKNILSWPLTPSLPPSPPVWQALVVFPLSLWAGWITGAAFLNTASLIRVCGACVFSSDSCARRVPQIRCSVAIAVPPCQSTQCKSPAQAYTLLVSVSAGAKSLEYDRPDQMACVIFIAVAALIAGSLIVYFKGCPWSVLRRRSARMHHKRRRAPPVIT